MFKLNPTILRDCGISKLPRFAELALLRAIHEQLEVRVGTRLSEGLTDAQLTEFDELVEGRGATIVEWVEKNAADFQHDPLYLELLESGEFGTSLNAKLLREYTTTKWLLVHRPEYRATVAAVFDELPAEFRAAGSGETRVQ